ncbi:MAG: DNA mismatch repair protein MutT [Desulfobacterales bacterium S5133MH16]|nr:MAG: DNA mismatch repair protein MutT [Desulfobacterales bacterium S5133MH16]
MVIRPLIGVAAIVIKDNKVLLGKRKNAHGAGTWAFPGGHLEFNESIEECAKREVFEETGIHIKNIRYGTFTNDIFREDQKHYVTLFVISEYDEGALELKEPEKCEKWEWFFWNELPEPRFLPLENLLKQKRACLQIKKSAAGLG